MFYGLCSEEFCILQNFDVTNQEAIDKFMIELDGTENKCKFFNFFFYKYVDTLLTLSYSESSSICKQT